ncbi:MAG: hypothetical protein WC449_06340 [Candidatus Paceibacterota bacterium]
MSQKDNISEWQFARITQIRKLKKQRVSIKSLSKRFGAALVDRALNTKNMIY